MKLTQRFADTVAFDPAQPEYWDDEVRGFGLRTFKAGAKSWVVRYRAEGRRRYMTLASTNVMKLSIARQEARAILLRVAKGEDPATERQRQAKQPTFGMLCDRYGKDHASRKKTGEADKARLVRSLPSTWRTRWATAISRADIKEQHAKLGEDKGPYEANRTLALLSKLFEFGREAQLVPDDHPNPAKGISRFTEEQRERYVTPTELERLLAALRNDEDVYTQVYFMVMLLTGLRRSELLNARWEDIDRDEKQLCLPQTKSGRRQRRPLSDPALKLFDLLPKTTNPYCFPGRVDNKPLTTMRKSWVRVCKAAGLKAGRDGITIHDLRRSFGSWLSQRGVELNVIRQVLGHSDIKTTLIYARLGADAGRDAVEDLGADILPEGKLVTTSR